MLLCLFMIPDALLSPAAADWLYPDWDHRLSVDVTCGDHERSSYPVVLELQLGARLAGGQHLDANSVRVVETLPDGTPVATDLYGAPAECVFQYDPTRETTAWVMSGTTALGQTRHFDVYFDAVENGPKLAPDVTTPPRFLNGNRKALAITGWGHPNGGYGLQNLMRFGSPTDVPGVDGWNPPGWEIEVISDWDLIGGTSAPYIDLINLDDYGLIVWDNCSSFGPTRDSDILVDFLDQGGKIIIGDNGVQWTQEGYSGLPPAPWPNGSALERHELLRDYFPAEYWIHMPYNTSRSGYGARDGFPTEYAPRYPMSELNDPNADPAYPWHLTTDYLHEAVDYDNPDWFEYVPGLRPDEDPNWVWMRHPDGPEFSDLDWEGDWSLGYFYWWVMHTDIWSVTYSGCEPWMVDEMGYTRSIAEGWNVLNGAPFHDMIRHFDVSSPGDLQTVFEHGYCQYLLGAMDFYGMADAPDIDYAQLPDDDSPEPATWVLLACTGMAGFFARRKRVS